MQRRDDLPEMTLPLAVLLTLLSCALSALAAYLMTLGKAGVAAAVFLVPAVSCLYSLVILLWRRLASLTATPLSVALMLLTGSGLYETAVISATVLLCSYVYATSMMAKENKFRRMISLSLSFSLCAFLALIGYAGLNYSSAEEFLSASLAGLAGLTAKLNTSAQTDVDSLTRSILLLIPAVIAIVGECAAFLTELLTYNAMRVLDCDEVFVSRVRDGSSTTMPKTYAAVFLASLVLSALTSPYLNPLVYASLKNVMLSLILPCAAVGFSSLVNRREDEYFYMTGKRILGFLLMALMLAALGMRLFAVLLAVLGAIRAIRSKNSQSTADNTQT